MVGSKPIDELSVYFSSGTEKTMWAELLRQTCDKKSLSSDLGCSELPLLTPTTPKRMPDIVETRTLTVAPHEHIGLNRTCLRLIDSIVAALQNPVLNLATFGTSLDMVLAFDFVVTGQPVLIPRLVQNTVIHILTYGTCTFSSFLTACGFDSHMAATRVRTSVGAALATEGIFRVAGVRDRMVELVEQINSTRTIAFSRDENPANVTGLLKQFLRDLPEPLISRTEKSAFLSMAGTIHHSLVLFVRCCTVRLFCIAHRHYYADMTWEQQRECLREICGSLSQINFDLLREILRVCYFITINESVWHWLLGRVCDQ